MAIDRTNYNALVDDSGAGTDGSIWGKTPIKDVLLDPIDAALFSALPMRTVATIPQATTTYLGPGNWDGTTETDVYFVAPYAGTVKRLYVNTDGPAGAGQSFTYTARKNAVDQTLTCSISGASAATANDTTHSFTVAAGDLITVKLVTSATATPRKHQMSIVLVANV